MGIIDNIVSIHYYGVIEEFKAIGIDLQDLSYEHLRNKWTEKNYKTKVHYENGKIVGFVTIIDEEPIIYVSQKHQRKGIGSELLEQSYIRDVWVMKGNTKAEKFYEKNGFNPTDSRETTKLGHDITEIKWVKDENLENLK